MELNTKFHFAKHSIHKALCGMFFNVNNICILTVILNRILKHFLHIADNIDTRAVLDIIRELVTNSNIYMNQNKNPNTLLLRDIAVYITKMFIIFGAIPSSYDAIGFPLDEETNSTNVRQIQNFRKNYVYKRIYNIFIIIMLY